MGRIYQHAQGGNRLQEAGRRPEQGDAEGAVEEAWSNNISHAISAKQCNIHSKHKPESVGGVQASSKIELNPSKKDLQCES